MSAIAEEVQNASGRYAAPGRMSYEAPVLDDDTPCDDPIEAERFEVLHLNFGPFIKGEKGCVFTRAEFDRLHPVPTLAQLFTRVSHNGEKVVEIPKAELEAGEPLQEDYTNRLLNRGLRLKAIRATRKPATVSTTGLMLDGESILSLRRAKPKAKTPETESDGEAKRGPGRPPKARPEGAEVN